MAITEKDLQEFVQYLGVDVTKVESLDKLKEHVGTEFIRKSQLKDSKELSDAIGSRMGGLETAIKRLAKENGVELSADLIQGKRVEDIIPIVETKLKETYNGKITQLQKQIEDKDSSKIIEEWQNKYTQLEQKKNDIEGLLTVTKTELETTKTNSLKMINDYKVVDIKKRSFEAVPFSKEATDLAKTGFRAILDEKYAVDLDETGAPYIKDKATNSRIPNPTRMGEFMTVEDVYKQEAEKNNLIAKVDNSKNAATFVKRNPVEVKPSGAEAQPSFHNPRRVTFKERNGG